MSVGVLPTGTFEFFNTQIFNAQIPKEGPRALSISVPFATKNETSFKCQLYTTMAKQQISQISSLYVDNSDNPAIVYFDVSVVNLSFPFPPNSAGFIPFLVPKNAEITISTDGNTDINVAFLNVPVPAYIWDTTGGGAEYVDCPASMITALGSAGEKGDYLDHVVIIPGTTSPGSVQIKDGGTTTTIFAGGASSVSSLAPFTVPIGADSTTGGWSIICGANVTAIAVGQFTSGAA